MRISRPTIRSVTTHAHASDGQVADFLHMRILRALSRSPGGITVAFPGGSTPFPIIEELVTRPLQWSRVNVFPTDDRLVDEEDEASNYGRLVKCLEPHGALVSPLAEGFDVPDFALVWLGMGADGHVASIFPGDNESFDEEADPVRRITPDPMPEDAPYERLTLTSEPIVSADEVVVVFRGVAKRKVYDEALRGGNDLPIRRILAARDQRGNTRTTCFA